MASWLKAAEDLFEVVDRRAKLVVSELSDEQSDSQASASNGLELKARKSKAKEKVPPGKTAGKTVKNTEAVHGQKTAQQAISLKVDKTVDFRNESAPEIVANHMSEASSEVTSDAVKDTGIPDVVLLAVSGTVENDTTPATEVPTTENNLDITYSPTNDVIPVASLGDAPERTSSSPLKIAGPNKTNWNRTDDANSKESVVVVDTSLAIDEAIQGQETTQKHGIDDNQENGKSHFPEFSPKTNRQVENKTDSSPMKVQDQIDEAQGLLKSAVTTGQSKEARLAKVCAGLSSRLQEYKFENAQLEELLVAERELGSSYEARIKQLQQDLSVMKAEAARVEANIAEVLATKNTEIESLLGTVDVLKKQVSTSEGKLVSLQANMEAIIRNRELTESRIIQALREELAGAERRAEEEHVAHNSTKMAAVEREVELEHRAIEASKALARIQRTADESTSRAAELEHKVALLEVECSSLTQEIQELESRNRRGQKKTAEENSQVFQIQAWQEEVEHARQCQRDAENKLSSMEAELQKMRVEIAGMKRDAEHYSRQEHMELEKRYRELTDLLYHKQTQLEAMASEKAAAEFQLEKELKRLHEAQDEAERSRASRRSSSLWEEDTDIKALEPLPLHHRHMAAASIQIQRAAKLLDSGAVRATRFLWRYPVARVLLLCYLVFVHLFLMYLLHRLQVQAEDFSSREFAAAIGLGNSSFP